MVNQIAKWGRGVFNMCDEPESPNEGARFRMYDIPESSNHGSCLKCMSLRNPKKEGVL